jgi:AMIN domain
MQSLKNLVRIAAIALLVIPAGAQTGPQVSVRAISVLSSNPLKLRIQTSKQVSPQTQMVSNPDRLVIDIPNAVPGAELRNVSVHRIEVEKVRVSLFSASPPTTRIVLDLKQPMWYRVVPDAWGLLVSLGTDSESSSLSQPTIGWVSGQVVLARQPVRQGSGQTTILRPAQPQPLAKNGVSVQFSNGLMSIHSNGATLSEVLFQIQKTTGAEMAIPSGTEQDRVASNFGPGTPSDVLSELLNGSGLNFVVVGSEADPNRLRSVLLSRASGGVDAPQPSGFAQSYAPPPMEDAGNESGTLQEVPSQAQGPPPEGTLQQIPPPTSDASQPQPNFEGGPPPDSPPN